METIRAWLSDCTGNHLECQSDQRCSVLPTRLIDVGVAPDDFVTLRYGGGLPWHTSYATLSHCWGKKQFFTLRTSNYNAVFDGIEISALPANFRDAIWVARQLGLSYLWIDSLCIVQDDTEDWMRESIRMAEVYTHAAFNIAATSSADVDGGLFSKRPRSRLSECYVNASWSDRSPTPYRVRAKSLWETKINSSPLMQRAWVLQESLLAQRNIYFAQGEVFWECQSKL